VPVAGEDVDAYFMGPRPKNDSRTSIELVTIEAVTISDLLELVEARIYRRDDFLAGVPASWSTGGGDLYDPTKILSVPLRGFELGEHQSLGSDQAMMLKFRVSNQQRPLTATDLRVIYRHGFRNHSQIVRVVYGAKPPVQATNRPRCGPLGRFPGPIWLVGRRTGRGRWGRG
jgi:hypothetical protein